MTQYSMNFRRGLAGLANLLTLQPGLGGPVVALLAMVISIGSGFARPGLADDKLDQERPMCAAKAEKIAARVQAPAVAITAEREAAALMFAQQNHPELASLLDGLKRNAPKEYQAALVDLDRAVERLGKVRERSAERYEFELAEWKVTSRIRLLAARLTMSSDPTVEAELRSALRERLDLRLANQRAERERLQVRVTKLDQQIEELASKSDATVEKQFLELQKTLPVARPVAKSKPKKAAIPTDVKSSTNVQK